MSAAGSSAELEGSTHTVHIRVSFHADSERRAQTVVAKLIDSAHEIANLPECECDLDVSVETSPLENSSVSQDAAGAPLRGHPPTS